MSNPSSANHQSLPAPAIILPANSSSTGSRTLFMGTGVPKAFIQMWNIEQTHLYGKGDVSENARWVFSADVEMSAGEHQLRARQTLGNETSQWSAPRSFTVVVPMEIQAPEIDEPQEGEQTDASPVFSGAVLQNGGTVDVFDLNANQLLVSATVQTDRSWRTQALKPLPAGEYRISALHRVAGKVSDWALRRTFSVRAQK